MLSGSTTINILADDVCPPDEVPQTCKHMGRVDLFKDTDVPPFVQILIHAGWSPTQDPPLLWKETIDTTLLTNGAHIIRAVAEDYAGNKASAQINITVKN